MLSVTLLLRAATRMQKTWEVHARQAGHDHAYALHRLDEAQRNLQRARYQLDKARDRGLALAAAHLEANLLGSLKALQEAARQAWLALERPSPVVPDVAFLLAEIRQLEDEFEEVQIDWDERFLGATTEPITLEGVYLGSFAIRLHWERLARCPDAQCFDVVALDPNPAATDDCVTHPHVKDRALCAGEAKVPLRKALEQGRLADAFCLIRGVLTHYNASSPHVSLDAWDGTSCQDCGRTVCDDDCCSCGGCDDDYCYDCTRSCAACDATRCLDCLQRCAVCEAEHCGQCLQTCARSGKDCCSGCLRACAACGAEVARTELDAETERCSSCRAPELAPKAGSDAAALNPPSNHQPTSSEIDDAPTLEPCSPAFA